MSGPKTSRYTLTAEQRRLLEAQRKIEQRKAIASESIKRYTKRLSYICGMFDDDSKIADELYSRTGNDNAYSDELSSLLDTVRTTIAEIKAADSSQLELIEALADKSRLAVEDANETVKKIQKIAVLNRKQLHTGVISDIDAGFDTSFSDIESGIVSPETITKNEIIARLKAIKDESYLSDDFINEANATIDKINEISDEAFIKNYIAVSAIPLIKRCQSFIDEYEKYKDEFDVLQNEYLALCQMYYLLPQQYLCNADSISSLKEEIQRIKIAAQEDDEQSYISDCIDAVMTEMGYNILGSRDVTKKNGKHFHNELYHYGDGTAVNVTYSSDGKIAMELGGVDNTDRLPDERETAELCGQMESFCVDFKEIEKRLVAKGVVLSDRISLLPPNPEYAQIINTEDYNMIGEAESLQVRKRQTATSASKSMKVDY